MLRELDDARNVFYDYYFTDLANWKQNWPDSFISFPNSLNLVQGIWKGDKTWQEPFLWLVKMERQIWSGRRSKSGTTSRGGLEYSGLKKPKRTFSFDFRPKFPESSAWFKACTEWHKTKVITLVSYKGTSVTIQWTNLKLQAITSRSWNARENVCTWLTIGLMRFYYWLVEKMARDSKLIVLHNSACELLAILMWTEKILELLRKYQRKYLTELNVPFQPHFSAGPCIFALF